MKSFMVSVLSVLSKELEQNSICALPRLRAVSQNFHEAGNKMVIALGDRHGARWQKIREVPPNCNSPFMSKITATEMYTSKPILRLFE